MWTVEKMFVDRTTFDAFYDDDQFKAKLLNRLLEVKYQLGANAKSILIAWNHQLTDANHPTLDSKHLENVEYFLGGRDPRVLDQSEESIGVSDLGIEFTKDQIFCLSLALTSIRSMPDEDYLCDLYHTIKSEDVKGGTADRGNFHESCLRQACANLNIEAIIENCFKKLERSIPDTGLTIDDRARIAINTIVLIKKSVYFSMMKNIDARSLRKRLSSVRPKMGDLTHEKLCDKWAD